MKLLLSSFNDDNINLERLLLNYQEYFIFEQNKNIVSLYLNTDYLKKYLEEGKEIKYRKFIFMFLQNKLENKKNKNYSIHFKNNKKKYQLVYGDKKLFYEKDDDNLKKIINLIQLKEDNTSIRFKNKNIIHLNNNLYGDIKNKFFFSNDTLKKYKFNIQIKGFVINHQYLLKNILMMMNILFHSQKTLNKINSNSGIKKTNCNLIITTKMRIQLWVNLLNKYNPNINIIEIHHLNKLDEYKNDDIIKSDYLFININVLINHLKIFQYKYLSENEISNILTSDNLQLMINDLINEENINKNWLQTRLTHFYMFEWNNIIIEDNDKLKKINTHYLTKLSLKGYYYIITEQDDIDLLIKDKINLLIDEQNIDIYERNNFDYFIKNELIIKNDNEKEIIDKNNSEVIVIQEDEEEYDILNKFQENKDIEKEIYMLKLKSTNQFFYKNNEEQIKIKLLSENHEIKNQEHLINNVIDKFNNQYFCCICMDRIEKKNFCLLGCCHYFCKNCILMHKINDKINHKESKCPMCRYEYKTIYNINEDNNEMSKIMIKLDDLLNKLKESKKKVLIVSEYNECLDYIQNKFKNKFNIQNYKKNKKNQFNCTNNNYILKNIISNIDIFIFIELTHKGYKEYLEILKMNHEYYNEKDNIKYYLIQYDKK